MTKTGTKSLKDAISRGLMISYRAEALHADWFVSVAEWIDGGTEYFAWGLRFRCDKDGKATYLAQQILKDALSEQETEPNNAMETTPVAVTVLAYARTAPSTSVSHL